MENKNINLNTPRNAVSNPSPAPASQRAARAAVEQGNNSPQIAVELQNSPQVADPHYTRLMRLLALSHQNLSAEELIHLFSKIENKDLQKKAYTKILESSKLSPEEQAKFEEAIPDPLILEQKQAFDKALNDSISVEERYAAARSIQNAQVQEQAFCAIVASINDFSNSDLEKLKQALQGLPQSLQDGVFYAILSSQSHLDLSKYLDIAKCIQDQSLQQQALLAIFEEGRKKINPLTLEVVLEAYSLLSPDLQNPVLRNELFKNYFDQYRILEYEFRFAMKYECSARAFMELIQNVFESANEEEKRTILFGIAKNINVDPVFGYYSGQPEDLFKVIQNSCSKALQQEFAYALLNQTLITGIMTTRLSAYHTVLEIFIPVSSVCDEDIDELIANVLSKEQPSFVFDPITGLCIVDPTCQDLFCHEDGGLDYQECGVSFREMCTAVLDLYMPCEQILLKTKNLMIETMVCNQSLSKYFREEIIKKYIQDPALAADLLSIVDQDLSDKRFKKTKLAARDEEQS